MKNTILRLAFCAALPVLAQQKATVIVHPDQGKRLSTKKFTDSLPNIWELVSMVVYG